MRRLLSESFVCSSRFFARLTHRRPPSVALSVRAASAAIRPVQDLARVESDATLAPFRQRIGPQGLHELCRANGRLLATPRRCRSGSSEGDEGPTDKTWIRLSESRHKDPLAEPPLVLPEPTLAPVVR